MRALLFGHSKAARQSYITSSGVYYTSEGDLCWLNRLWGRRITFDPALNKGVGGETSNEWMARFDADVIANLDDFDIAFITDAHNDINASIPFATSLANYKLIIQTLAGCGKWVVVNRKIPDWLSTASDARYHAGIVNALTEWARAQSFLVPVILIDFWGDLINPASAIGAPADGVILPDGVHQASAGGYLIGKRMVETLSAMIPAVPHAAMGDSEGYDATVNPYGNLLGNSCLFGTSGTLNNGTGVVADGWTLERSSGSWSNSEIVASKEVLTAGYGGLSGEKQVIQANISSGKSDTERVTFYRSVNIPTQSAAYRIGSKIDILNAVGVHEVSVSVRDVAGSYFSADGTNIRGAGNLLPSEDMHGLSYESPAWQPPSGTTQAVVEISVTVDASVSAASFTAKIGAPYLRKMMPVTTEKQKTFAVISTTRDMSAASGTQSLSGIGFRPKAAFIIAAQASNVQGSIGFSDGVSNLSIYDRSGVATGYFGANAAAVTAVQSVGINQVCSVQSLDSDGVTLNWTRNGSPSTGTLYVYLMLLR